MLRDLIFGNISFAVNLFAAFIFFSVFWLHLDSWSNKRTLEIFLKFIGFLLLSVSFLLQSVYLEELPGTSELFKSFDLNSIWTLLKAIGLSSVLISLIIEPVQKKPITKPMPAVLVAAGAIKLSGIVILHLINPILLIACAVAYLYHVLRGLEKHLKMLSISFFMLGRGELLSLTGLIRRYNYFDLYNNYNFYILLRPYGPLWIIQQILLLISVSL